MYLPGIDWAARNAVDDTSELQMKQVELEKMLSGMHDEERDAKDQMSTVAVEESKLEQALLDVQAELEEITTRRDALADSSRELKRHLTEQRRKMQANRKKVDDFAVLLDAKRVDLEALRARVQTETAQAVTVFPERVKVTRAAKELEDVVAARERAIRKQQQEQGRSMEEIEAEFLAVKKKLRRVKRDLALFEETLADLSKSLEKRHVKLKRMRHLLGEQVSVFFNWNLLKRGYEVR